MRTPRLHRPVTVLAVLLACAGCGSTQPEEAHVAEPKTIYLVKANDDLVSHCKCENALITGPPQLDCPWCGCGWLFTCVECRKAFTFATAVEVDATWRELALNDLKGKWTEEPSEEDVADWIEFMKILLKDIEPGRQYVYIDGWVFPADSSDVRFEGWHSLHEFDVLPHVAALKERSLLDRTLASEDYWLSRKVEEE